MRKTLTRELAETPEAIDGLTVSNAVERFKVWLRRGGFMGRQIVCWFRKLGIFVGHVAMGSVQGQRICGRCVGRDTALRRTAGTSRINIMDRERNDGFVCWRKWGVCLRDA